MKKFRSLIFLIFITTGEFCRKEIQNDSVPQNSEGVFSQASEYLQFVLNESQQLIISLLTDF